MDFKYIEQLLERYWQCETSLEEEAQLRTFFTEEDVPEHLSRYSDLFVYDASNIRLSNISLAYRVPAHWCKKISLSGARLQFNVENVATFAFDSKANYDLGGKVKPNYVWGLYLNF